MKSRSMEWDKAEHPREMKTIQQGDSEHRKRLITQLDKAIPLLKERGVEKITVYGSILAEKRFQWISDIDLALSGKKFSFREQLRILSLLEEIFPPVQPPQ